MNPPLNERPIFEIAHEIQKIWKNVSPHAQPYLDAMKYCDKPDDMYIYESAKTQVAYFLSNASGWRGEDARRIKKELKDMCDFN